MIREPRLLQVTHSVVDILRARMLAIACGYEDADDLDHLRSDPGFKLACGRLPDTGDDLCSQPTMSRWENEPILREVIRMTYAMIDAYCVSYPKPPVAVTLDIDDTVDVVHGHQQLSLFNAHYDERCFLPIHVYETATSRPVAVLLGAGKTPSGNKGTPPSSAPADTSHPQPLAHHAADDPWRRSLQPSRGDGWCEVQRSELYARTAGNVVLCRWSRSLPTTQAAPGQAQEAVVRRLPRPAMAPKLGL